MRKTLCTIALTGLLGLGMTAFAQDQSTASTTTPPPMHGPHGRMMNPDNQLAHLTKALTLTSDQQTQIKPILEDQQQQMMQIHQDTSLSRDDKMTKAKALHQDTTTKIEAVLTPDQKTKYDAMQARMQERMQHRKQGADATSPNQPQQ